MTKDVGDCAAEELQFWEIVSEDDSIALHKDAPVVIYDLEERTAGFGETIIRFAKKIPRSPVNNRLIDQLVGAGTSVGAPGRRMTVFPNRISNIASASAGRRRGKPNSSCAWSRWLSQI